MITINPDNLRFFNEEAVKFTVFSAIDGLTNYHGGVGYVGRINALNKYMQLDRIISDERLRDILVELEDEGLITIEEKRDRKYVYSFSSTLFNE